MSAFQFRNLHLPLVQALACMLESQLQGQAPKIGVYAAAGSNSNCPSCLAHTRSTRCGCRLRTLFYVDDSEVEACKNVSGG